MGLRRTSCYQPLFAKIFDSINQPSLLANIKSFGFVDVNVRLIEIYLSRRATAVHTRGGMKGAITMHSTILSKQWR